MLQEFMEVVFGCWHRNYSFPITIKTRRAARSGATAGTYVVCLDCGRELAYDWSRMRLADRVARSPSPASTFESPVVV